MKRTLVGCIAGMVVGLLVAAGLVTAPRDAAAASAAVPYDSTVRFSGYGFGHGWGMSQYGAYGAALKGLSWQKIINFYYPGTTLASLSTSQQIRIWISADTDKNTTVKPATGLRVKASGGKTYTLPTTSGTKAWRIVRSADAWKLERQDSSGWQTQSTALPTGDAWWSFENTSTGVVDLVLPSTSTVRYRGSMQLIQDGSALRTVNALPMESYLRGVIAAEMPASWHTQALRAQAVAARTYAAKRLRPTAAYDLCDTTTCQVYKGISAEASGSDTAISATAHQVVKYGSGYADTLFSASNGGWTVSGGQPYLPAKADPYDGVVQNQAWTASATTTEISNAFGVGTVRKLEIVARDGHGNLGGRVTSVRITGSSKTVTVSGDTLRGALGLRSSMLNVVGGLRPGGPAYNFWQAQGGVTGWIGMPTGDERAVSGGSAVPMAGAKIYTGATGTHEVHGGILRVYEEMGGPAEAGLPTSNEVDGPVPGSRMSTFANNVAIYWSRPTGTHEVRGGVRTKYLAAGGPAKLGLPTTGELAGPVTGSRVSNFDTTRVSIYWSHATGAHIVRGGIRSTYQAVVGSTPIGLPTTDEVDGPVAGSRKSTFTGGAIYWSHDTGAHEIHGGIWTLYRKVNGEKTLGLPTSNEMGGANGARYSNFSSGAIYWSSATGARMLTGATLAKYRALGADKSSLGLPTGDMVTSGTVVTTPFQHGTLVCTGSSCVVK